VLLIGLVGCSPCDTDETCPEVSVCDEGYVRVDTLRAAAECTGVLIGTALTPSPLDTDADYAEIAGTEFNYITPENAMKWKAVEEVEDEWDFEDADAVVDFAEAHGQAVKGHVLVWHKLPPWIDENISAEDLEAAMSTYITTMVERYRGRVFAWDVVNEVFEFTGTYRRSILYEKLGEDFIADAFRLAHAADPDAILLYNDYDIEGVGAKSDAVHAMVSELLADGVPIHGVGFQTHLNAATCPSASEVEENFHRFGELGINVNISEMDLRIAKLVLDASGEPDPGNLDARLGTQKVLYHQYVSACLAEPACDAITFWGFTDARTWVDGFFGPDDPLLFDDQYHKKPAYFGVRDALVGLPLAATGGNRIRNPGFEDDTDHWTSWEGSIAASSEQARTGDYSVRSYDRTADHAGPVQSLLDRLEPGGAYSVSVWARLRNDSGPHTIKTTMRRSDGSGIHYDRIATAEVTDSAWTLLEGTWIFEAKLPIESLSFYVEGPPPEVEYFVDDVRVSAY